MGRIATRVARRAVRPLADPNSRLGDRVAGWAANRVLERMIAKTENVSTVRWLGRPVWQYPLDLWVLQEVISEQRPDVIVETGTHRGGSAFFFATLCDLLGHGEVVSVDIAPLDTVAHERITYLTGSSVDPDVVAHVRDTVGGRRALVVLDSDHSAAHVKRELDAYAELVPPGGFIHVQDGCIDMLATFTRHPETGAGPVPAIKQFLAENKEFVRALDVERRYIMTAHPFGWLRRMAAEPSAASSGRVGASPPLRR